MRRVDPLKQLICLLLPVHLVHRSLSVVQSLAELFWPDQLELLVDPLLGLVDSLDVLY